MRKQKKNSSLNLHAGDWVEVRSIDEILSTLDNNQCLDGLPFMPEMLRYCGKRFRVYKSAHKTCDTIDKYVIRRMDNTVHLDGLRCDGQDHGGCQASCLLFWKEAWLKPVPSGSETESQQVPNLASGLQQGNPQLKALYEATQVRPENGNTNTRYRCQTTELLNATKEVRRRERLNPLFYIRDVTSGNVGLWDFLRYGAFAIVNNILRRWQGKRYPHVCGLAGDRTPHASLNMQPGELVRVKSKEEIFQTLNSKQRNRGLFFDVEMIPYCGEENHRVLRRVEKIINEKTGEMMHLPNPCIILDGVTCGGKLSSDRMFCPRSIYPYWREIWLERAEEKSTGK